jgi:hypothetical protein
MAPAPAITAPSSVLYPPAAQGLAPGRRLRPALSQGQDVHARPPFDSPVDLDDPVILRNLSEPEVGKVLFDHFRAAINALTIYESGSSRIDGHIRLRDTRPFRTEPRGFLPAKRPCSIASSAKRTPMAWNWPLRRSWKRARTCRPSARTTWPWVSRLIT